MKRKPEHVRLAEALGLEVEEGKKHYKVLKAGRLVAVLPKGSRGRERRNSHAMENLRACLVRAAREEQ